MLPLDEEPFDVDADTRLITVPNSFRRSGIGVTGDEIAETLFIRIDRFFDAMDFDTCKAYVQWENAAGEQFITPLTMKDLESEPGKIIYAWPISSKVTKASGPVRFSLRIVKFAVDEETIKYSFSTLTANTNINAGLNYTINGEHGVEEDTPNDLFDEVISNSENSTGPSAAAPEFLSDLESPVYLVHKVNKYTVEILASAGVSDTGEITYKWYHKNNLDAPRVFLGVEDAGKPDLVEHFSPKKKFVKVEADAEYNVTARYYVAVTETTDSDGPEGPEEPVTTIKGYKPWEPPTAPAELQADFKQKVADGLLFQRFTALTITGTKTQDEDDYVQLTGIYYIEAVNRTGNRESTTKSKNAVIPAPTTLTVEVPEGLERFIEDGACDVEIKATSDEKTTLSYEWTKCHTAEGEYATDEQFTGATARITEPNFYKVNVTSMLNLDTIHETSEIIKVMKAPEAPVFQVPAEDTIVSSKTQSEVTVVLANAEQYNDKLISDRIEYIWYYESDMESEGLEEYTRTDVPTVAIPRNYLGPIVCKAVNHLSDRSAESEMSKQFVIST